MGLDSSSTLQDALDQYNNNLAWEGNITKAKNILEAIRYLLVNRGQSLSEAGSNLTFESLKEMQADVKAFVDTASPRSETKRATFTRPTLTRY